MNKRRKIYCNEYKRN